MNCFLRATAIGACLLNASSAYGGLTDFYVTNASGTIYQVNGDTLESSAIHEVQLGGNDIGDIEYLGNGRFLASVTFGMTLVDVNTQDEEILFSTSDVLTTPGSFGFMFGVTARQAGDYYFCISALEPGVPLHAYGVAYDFDSGTFTELAETPAVSAIGYLEVNPDFMISTDHATRSVQTYNPNTGEVYDQFAIDLQVVSAMQNGSDIFLLTQTADLYLFDPYTGSTSLHGTISNVSGQLIGVTVPGSSTLLVLASSLGIMCKRRR